MNVWIFQTGEPLHSDQGDPRPMRAMNLANTLVESGHSVTIWSSNFYHQEKHHRESCCDSKIIRINKLLKIHLIQSRGYERNISLKRLLDHAELAVNLKKSLSKEENTPDVAFVGYPPIEFALVAVNWLKTKGVPSMLDVKDQWPHIFVDAFPKPVRPLARIIFSPYYYFGRKVLINATAFCSMAQGFLDWMSRFSGRPLLSSDCLVPLSPLPQAFPEESVNRATNWWMEQGIGGDNQKRFFFVGSLSQAFDFEPIIEAARHAQENNLNWQFVICGDGDNADQIKESFIGLSNVIFPGWIDRPKVVALAKLSTIGLAPYKNTDNFISNLPNKIIDYLSLGKPIASPLQGEVERLIQDESVGIHYGRDHTSTLYELLREVCADPQTLAAMSEKAAAIYEKRFSGEKVYLELMERLVNLSKYSNSE